MKVIKYIGGVIKDTNERWGGTIATNNMFIRAFENDSEYKVVPKYRNDFKTAEEIQDFIKDADIVHIDDTTIATLMFKAGMKPPDVIGVITRSPIKTYPNEWRSEYTKEWFYSAKIIRLNVAEEMEEPSLISGFVKHAVDIERIIPDYKHPKKYILWAGDIKRYAKNYEMFQEIMKTKLPEGYEFKVLTAYNVKDYWDMLKEAAILVNTSRYESFCSAGFEAMAAGVPVIWQKGLQRGVHEDGGIRVDYDVKSYSEKICNMIINNEFIEEGKKCRKYVEENCSFKHMRDSIATIYDGIK